MASSASPTIPEPKSPPRDRSHWLYIAVIIAVVAGVIVGYLFPSFGKELKNLGDLFVALIKMMISPVIFCTIVLGIGSVRAAASVGRAGGLALGYFITMSTFALAIGLVVGNLLHPGTGLHAKPGAADKYIDQAHGGGGGTWDFFHSLIPDTLFSAVTSGSVSSEPTSPRTS